MTRLLPPLSLNFALLLPSNGLLIASGVACRINLRKLTSTFFVPITIVALHNRLRDLFAIFGSTQSFLFRGDFIRWSRSSSTFVSSQPILLIWMQTYSSPLFRPLNYTGVLLTVYWRSLSSIVFSYFFVARNCMTGLMWLRKVLLLDRMRRTIVVGALIVGKFIRGVFRNMFCGGTLDRVSFFVRLHERGCRSAWINRTRKSWIFQIFVILSLKVKNIWTQVYLVNLDILALLSIRVLRRAGSVEFVAFARTFLALQSLNLCSLRGYSLS